MSAAYAVFDLKRAPVARILIPFVAGSLAGYHLSCFHCIRTVILICAVLWIILFILYQGMDTGTKAWQGLFSMAGCMLITCIGFGTGHSTRPSDPGLPTDQDVIVRGEILDEPALRNNKYVFELKTDMVGSADSGFISRTLLKVYMTIPVDSSTNKFPSIKSGQPIPQSGQPIPQSGQPIPQSGQSILKSDHSIPGSGEIWQMAGRLVAIRNSGNPGEPDYESIMQRRDCWYRFFADAGSAHTYGQAAGNILESPINGPVKLSGPIRFNATRIRNTVSGWWEGEEEKVSLIKAVCLGDRTGLTDDLKKSYSAAGGMHLLAVSGLHVGLIWWVLNRSLAWMVLIFRKRIYRALTIMMLLWIYASITGFSSSVSRSVTMFTFFTLARMIEQRSHPVNGILVSAFVLLIINPGRIHDVGFQLSYAAILGIVTLQPALVGMLKVKYRALKWAWEVTGVSLAAQLCTAPLVVYYFHQLPAYALITNLVAIPLLSGLIALVMFSIPLLAAGILSVQINWLLCGMAGIMNRLMEWVGSLPGSVVYDLNPDRVTLGLYMVMVTLLILILKDRTRLSRHLFAMFFIITLGWSSWIRYRALITTELVIAHFNGSSLVTFRDGLNLDHYLWSRDPEKEAYMVRYLEQAWPGRRYRSTLYPLAHTGQIKGSVSNLIQVDQGIWLAGNNKIHGIIVHGSVHRGDPTQLEKLIRMVEMDFLLVSDEPGGLINSDILWTGDFHWIIDGSNRTWFTNRLDVSYLEIPHRSVHYTGIQGAYTMRR